MDRRNYMVDLDLMVRLKAYAALSDRTLQDVHMDAIREYVERHGAKPARRKRVIRADEQSGAA